LPGWGTVGFGYVPPISIVASEPDNLADFAKFILLNNVDNNINRPPRLSFYISQSNTGRTTHGQMRQPPKCVVRAVGMDSR
jgi:hypothetical protein